MKSIIIHDYMIKDLKLKGFALLIYAVVNSFSSFGQVCFVKEETFCDFLGCSRSQFYKARAELEYLGFIIPKGKGYVTYDKKEESLQLEEMIRIAKTPWLD